MMFVCLGFGASHIFLVITFLFKFLWLLRCCLISGKLKGTVFPVFDFYITFFMKRSS